MVAMTKTIKYTCDKCGKSIQWWNKISFDSNHSGFVENMKDMYFCRECFNLIIGGI